MRNRLLAGKTLSWLFLPSVWFVFRDRSLDFWAEEMQVYGGFHEGPTVLPASGGLRAADAKLVPALYDARRNFSSGSFKVTNCSLALFHLVLPFIDYVLYVWAQKWKLLWGDVVSGTLTMTMVVVWGLCEKLFIEFEGYNL